MICVWFLWISIECWLLTNGKMQSLKDNTTKELKEVPPAHQLYQRCYNHIEPFLHFKKLKKPASLYSLPGPLWAGPNRLYHPSKTTT